MASQYVDPLLQQADQRLTDLNRQIDELSAQLPELEAELAALNAKYPRPETEIDTDEVERIIKFNDPKGLKIVLAKLMTGTHNLKSKDNQYMPVYVHSKLLLVDDVFCKLGSANINKRSMLADSELAIALPHVNFARALRQQLWHNHAGFFEDDLSKNHEKWIKIMDQNWRNMHDGLPLEGFLTHFYDPSTPPGPNYD